MADFGRIVQIPNGSEAGVLHRPKVSTAAFEWSHVNEVVMRLSDGQLKSMLVDVLSVTYADAMSKEDDDA